MMVGAALIDLAVKAGARGIAVVGTGKNVGKTVTVRAILQAAQSRGLRVGLASIGRDGEALDAGDTHAKPRLLLAAGTAIATARVALPATPASEILAFSDLITAVGPLIFARVRTPAYYEIIGPPTASGIRAALDVLVQFDTDLLVLDGAVDRVAALAGGDQAIVVATGAAAAGTPGEAAIDAHALIERLRLRRYDDGAPHVRVDGALTPTLAAALIAGRESRQVVVGDPTQVAIAGKAFLGVAKRLALRCERPLRVIAATVASIGPERYFEPTSFARAVADATHVPTFDVYAGTAAA
jgi:hypothetical protein